MNTRTEKREKLKDLAKKKKKRLSRESKKKNKNKIGRKRVHIVHQPHGNIICMPCNIMLQLHVGNAECLQKSINAWAAAPYVVHNGHIVPIGG